MANYFDQFDNINNKSQGKPQSTFWDTIDIINRNFADVANGGLQAGAQALELAGFDMSSFKQNIAQQQAMHEKDYRAALQNSPIVGTIADVGSKIGSAVATPGNQFLLGATGPTTAGRMGLTAAAAANTGGQEYVNEGESRLDNALNAGFIGGAVQGGLEGVGQLAKYGVSKLFKTPVQEAAESFNKGILTTAGSATGNKAIQGTEDVLGRIPVVGAKGAINKQVNALRNETSSVMDDLGVGLKSDQVLGNELQQGISSTLKGNRPIVNAKYDKALDYATKNKLSIPLTETQSIAKNALNDLKDLSSAGVNTNISSKSGQLLQDLANLPEGQLPAKMFDTLRRKVKSSVDNLVGGADDEGILPALQNIKKSLDDDLMNAGAQDIKFGKLLIDARKSYQDLIAPFKDIPSLDKSVRGKIDTDQLLNGIVKGNRPVMTSKIMDVLSSDAKKTFSAAVVQKAFRNSITKTGDGIEQLNLGQFSTQIHNLGETINALPKVEQMKLKGLQKLLTRGDNLIKTASANPNNLPTWLGAIAGTGVGVGAGIGPLLLAGGMSKLISKALTSKTITKNLIKLAGGKLAQTGEDGLIKGTLRALFKGVKPAIASEFGTN